MTPTERQWCHSAAELMPDEASGNYDWREGLHTSMKAQKENVDKLLGALRDLIDRIPPENLR